MTRLRLLPPVVIALLVFAQAAADECERLPAPSVTVTRLEEPITINTQYGYRELTHLGSDIARTGQAILGLTRGKARASFSVTMTRHPDKTRRWECASPQILLTYGFSPMTIYVAKEIPKGTCAYDEVLRHEMRHVTAYRSHLAAIEPKVREALTARFVTGEPWRGPLGQPPRQLQREISERWQPYMEHEINLGMAAQKEIDAPEEYARVLDSCNGEIRRLTRQ